jgi:hypothetical protein
LVFESDLRDSLDVEIELSDAVDPRRLPRVLVNETSIFLLLRCERLLNDPSVAVVIAVFEVGRIDVVSVADVCACSRREVVLVLMFDLD